MRRDPHPDLGVFLLCFPAWGSCLMELSRYGGVACPQCYPDERGVNLSDLRAGLPPSNSVLPDGRPPFLSMLPLPAAEWVVGQPSLWVRIPTAFRPELDKVIK